MAAILNHPRPSMPGSFFTENNHKRNHMSYDAIFRPPQSSPRPSLNRSGPMDRSSTSLQRTPSRSGESARKRPRLNGQLSSTRSIHTVGTSSRGNSYYGFDGTSSYPSPSLSGSVYSFDATSPPPMVSTTYEFAGGLDPPSAAYEQRLEDIGNREEQLDWRMNRYRSVDEPSTPVNFSSTEGSYVTAAHSRSHMPPMTPTSQSINEKKRSFEHTTPQGSPSKPPNPGTLTGWHIRSRAWALTGGLAFKAINFCWNTAFGGFSAGGGQAYQLDVGTSQVSHQGLRIGQLDDHQDVFSNAYRTQDERWPGGFPESAFVEEDLSNRRSGHWDRDGSNATPTAASYAHSGMLDSTSSLRNDGWTIIDGPSPHHPDLGFSSGSLSHRRRTSGASVAGSRASPIHPSRPGFIDMAAATGASFASSRSGVVMSPQAGYPHHNRSYSSSSASLHHKDSSGRLGSPEHQYSLNTRSNRRLSSARASISSRSIASPAASRRQSSSYFPHDPSSTSGANQAKSPISPTRSPSRAEANSNGPSSKDAATRPVLTPELQKYKTRIRRKQKATDQSMARLNAQMQDLIRQGKEALGSRVVIVDDDGYGGGGADPDCEFDMDLDGPGVVDTSLQDMYTRGSHYSHRYDDDHDRNDNFDDGYDGHADDEYDSRGGRMMRRMKRKGSNVSMAMRGT